MAILANRNTLLIALTASLLAVTGCSSKSHRSQVAVSPLGMSGTGSYDYGYGNAYSGGALVNNTAAVAGTANGLQSIVYFGFDSSDINAEGTSVLDQHAVLLAGNQGSRVLVVGHTDPRGSREYNMALGERRAQSVRDYLASQGIDPNSVEIVSRGEEEPAVEGNTEEAYAQDRRAVLSY